MKRRICQTSALMLATTFLLTVSVACSNPTQNEDAKGSFTQALFDGDYSEAQRIYQRQSVRASDDMNSYHRLIQDRMDQIEERYLSDIMTYDQAAVQLEQLMFTESLETALGSYRNEKLLEMNKARAEDDRLRLASELNDLGSHREALELYQSILDQEPEHAEALRGFRQATNGYINTVQQKVSTLRSERLINQALVLVRASLKLLPDHQDLINLESTLQNDLENASVTLDTRTALVEIQQLLTEGQYEEAMKLIETTKEDPDYSDRIEELEQMANQVRSARSLGVLADARSAAPGQNLSEIHWERRPFETALQLIEEGLEVTPEDQDLVAMRDYYSKVMPVNLFDQWVVDRGQVQSDWTGHDYFGYAYQNETAHFNQPLRMKGAFEMKLNNQSGEGAKWNKMHLVFSPAEKRDGHNYNDYDLYILVDGEEVERFDGNFEDLSQPIVYDLNLSDAQVVEVKLIRDTFFGRLGSGGNEPFYMEAFGWNELEEPSLTEATASHIGNVRQF